MYEAQFAAIDQCLGRIAGGYEGHEQDVLAIIDDCEAALKATRAGAVGPWERRELEYARNAVRSGFLRLALVATEKALEVSQLPRAEYEYGLNYGKFN